MIEYLQDIDAQMLLTFNGMNSPYLDRFFWHVTHALSWLPMMLVFVAVSLRAGWRRALVVAAALGVVVLIADQLSSSLIKPLVQRPRPTHDPQLGALVHVVDGYRGGAYGFVSSHAANHLGVAVLLGAVLRHRLAWLALITWAVLISYSRCYLGVHYPGDILGGWLVGLVASGVALLALQLWQRRCDRRWRLSYFRGDALLVAAATAANLLLIAIYSCFA